jgi:hypothetical protein
MMSAFLSRVVTVVTLEVVTPAFLTWSLALLALLPLQRPGRGGRGWRRAVALGVQCPCWLCLPPKPLRYCPR